MVEVFIRVAVEFVLLDELEEVVTRISVGFVQSSLR